MRVTWSGVWWWCLDFFPGVWRKNQIALNFSTQVSTLTSGTHLSMFSSALLFYGEVPTPHRNILFTELYVFQPFSKVRLRDQRPENIARPLQWFLSFPKAACPYTSILSDNSSWSHWWGLLALFCMHSTRTATPFWQALLPKEMPWYPYLSFSNLRKRLPEFAEFSFLVYFPEHSAPWTLLCMPWHQWLGKKSRDLTDFKV